MSTEIATYYTHMNELLAEIEEWRKQIDYNHMLVEALRGKIGRLEWKENQHATTTVVPESTPGLFDHEQRGCSDPPEEAGE